MLPPEPVKAAEAKPLPYCRFMLENVGDGVAPTVVLVCVKLYMYVGGAAFVFCKMHEKNIILRVFLCVLQKFTAGASPMSLSEAIR